MSRHRASDLWSTRLATSAPSLHVVVEGTFELRRAGELGVSRLAAGDLLLLGLEDPRAASAPHLLSLSSVGGPSELLSLRPTSTATVPPGVWAQTAVTTLPARVAEREPGLSSLVSLLRAEMEDVSRGVARADSLVEPLVVFALHAALHDRGQTEGADAADDERVERALRAFRERPAARWTVASLARVACLSRAAFARRFLATVGMPPLRYLAAWRMELAARLLVESDASLSVIAAEVGYESEFAFGRAFKRFSGDAPGSYRRRVGPRPLLASSTALRAAA